MEYDSWADELLLCGSDETLIRPSDILTPAPTDFPSPLPFSRLGVVLPILNVEEAAEAFGRRVEFDDRSAASGLPGTLLLRLGGWGNELMLTAFFKDFPGGSTPGGKRGRGAADARAGDVGAVECTLDGVRSPFLGVLAADFEGVAPAARRLPVLFRVLGTGRAGRATFGGPLDGRDGRGRVVAMMAVVTGRLSGESGRIELLEGYQGKRTKSRRLSCCSVNADACVLVHEQ